MRAIIQKVYLIDKKVRESIVLKDFPEIQIQHDQGPRVVMVRKRKGKEPMNHYTGKNSMSSFPYF